MELRIFLAALLPFAAAAALLSPAVLLRSRRRRGAAPLPLPLAGGAAVAVAYMICHLTVTPGLPWPAISADERLFWLVPAAALLGGAAGARPGWVPGRRLLARLTRVEPEGRDNVLPALPGLRDLFAIGAVWWLLQSALEHAYTGAQGAWVVVGGWAVIRILAGGSALLARRRPGFLTPALLATTSVAVAALLVLGRSAKLGQLSGGVAAAFSAVALIALWRRSLVLAGGATEVFAFALAGLLLIGAAYAYLPWSAALLAVAAPLVPALAELPGLRTLGCRGHAAARVLLLLLPLSGALLIAWQALPEPYEY